MAARKKVVSEGSVSDDDDVLIGRPDAESLCASDLLWWPVKRRAVLSEGPVESYRLYRFAESGAPGS